MIIARKFQHSIEIIWALDMSLIPSIHTDLKETKPFNGFKLNEMNLVRAAPMTEKFLIDN